MCQEVYTFAVVVPSGRPLVLSYTEVLAGFCWGWWTLIRSALAVTKADRMRTVSMTNFVPVVADEYSTWLVY